MDTAGWITDNGEVKLVNHEGEYHNEIHHVDLVLDVFGDQLDYPGRGVSHYNIDNEDTVNEFWQMYGEPAKELAFEQGWIMFGNSMNLTPTMFFAGFTVTPPKRALATLSAMVKKTQAERYMLEMENKDIGMDGDEAEAMAFIRELSTGILEEVATIRRLAGLTSKG